MSLDLKHIPCPAGDSCTAFRCIFGHARDPPRAPTTSTELETIENSESKDETASADQEQPRKRPKKDHFDLALEEPSTSTIKKAKELSSTNLPERRNSKARTASPDSLITAKRPISPPPFKRAALGTTGSRPALNLSSAVPRSSSSQSSPSTAPQATDSSKPRKAESLNPRLVKLAPASHEIRYKLLTMLHMEFSRLNLELKQDSSEQEEKLTLSDQELILRALDEEQSLAVSKAAVYSNVMKNKIMQYKRMGVAQWKDQRTKEVESGKKRKVSAQSDEPIKIETGLTPPQEVRLLKRILTPISDLSEHGYVLEAPSDESIQKAFQGLEASQGWEKCDRCQQRFQVFPGRREEDGALTSGGRCNFHWGKAYVGAKAPGNMSRQPKRYRCCGQEVGDSAGCFTQNYHVFKASDAKRLATVLNFASTPPNDLVPEDRAVCFDCEMGYTVHGMELIRVTATSWPTGEILLDVLVRPVGEILDLNSRFSGVWPDDLAQAIPWSAAGLQDDKLSKSGADSTREGVEVRSKRQKMQIVSSPEVARDLLFSLISPSTPLIGHGLENDLNAMRIIHPTLIDTVLLYPHRAGLPYRHGLKALMDMHLNKKIQQENGSEVTGHDSAEDARAAGELVRLRIVREWKECQIMGWKSVDGEFVAPGVKTVVNDGKGGVREDIGI